MKYAVILACVLAVGILSEPEAETLRMSPQFPDLPDYLRCPKRNAAGEWLQHEIAQRADAGNWELDCRYTDAKL